jgi:hypothetical protein
MFLPIGLLAILVTFLLSFLDLGGVIGAFTSSVIPVGTLVVTIGITLAFMQRRFAKPEHNAFLLTRYRAIHVFWDGQTTQTASVPLDSRTKVVLSPERNGSGMVLIKRHPGPGETIVGLSFFRPRRIAWSGVRFMSTPQAEYVRDVANWAIAQNRTGI